MSRAGDPTTVTWSLLGLAVAYSGGLVGRALVDTELGVLLVVALPVLCGVLAVGALLRHGQTGWAAGITALVVLWTGLLFLAYFIGLFLVPVAVLLVAAVLAPPRRWDSA